jgi:hypothetical protein
MSDETNEPETASGVPRVWRIPNRPPDRAWGGPGTGGPCAACGEPVTPDEVEYELEYARDDGEGGTDIHRVHLRCFRGSGPGALQCRSGDGTLADRERKAAS